MLNKMVFSFCNSLMYKIGSDDLPARAAAKSLKKVANDTHFRIDRRSRGRSGEGKEGEPFRVRQDSGKISVRIPNRI